MTSVSLFEPLCFICENLEKSITCLENELPVCSIYRMTELSFLSPWRDKIIISCDLNVVCSLKGTKMWHASGRCLLGLGTKSKCQSKSLEIEDTIICGMWQITVWVPEWITREAFLNRMEDGLIPEWCFWNLVYCPCMFWGWHNSCWNSEILTFWQ